MRVIVALMSAVLCAMLGCGSAKHCANEELLGCAGDDTGKVPTQFLLGYAEVEITPPLDTVMAAYGPPGATGAPRAPTTRCWRRSPSSPTTPTRRSSW